jgi:hypothetical protein
VVRRILNFQTRTSDKLVYRAPTRGLQGNAMKTIIRIPHALGEDEPVIIEAQGIHHEIRAWTDPAGRLHIDHQETPTNEGEGTLVSLLFPGGYLGLAGDLWGRAFTLFNPHVFIQIVDSQRGQFARKQRRRARRGFV